MRKILLLMTFSALFGLAALPAMAGISSHISGPGGGVPGGGPVGPATLSGTVLYNNDFGGVTSGDGLDMDAWTINFGYNVGNSFSVGSNSTLTGIEFAAWAYPGDGLTSVDWAVYADNGNRPPGGGAPYGALLASGTANPTEGFVETNGNGYDVLDESFGIPDLGLTGGTTYWLRLQNAVSNNGNPFYWDQSDGPSLAYENADGWLPADFQCGGLCTGSESFKLYGSGASGVPEPGTLALFGVGLMALGVLRRRRT